MTADTDSLTDLMDDHLIEDMIAEDVAGDADVVELDQASPDPEAPVAEAPVDSDTGAVTPPPVVDDGHMHNHGAELMAA